MKWQSFGVSSQVYGQTFNQSPIGLKLSDEFAPRFEKMILLSMILLSMIAASLPSVNHSLRSLFPSEIMRHFVRARQPHFVSAILSFCILVAAMPLWAFCG